MIATDRHAMIEAVFSVRFFPCLYNEDQLPLPVRNETDRKEGFVVRKLQRVLSSMKTWCERWNIKINEDEGIYFSRSRRPPESHLALNGRNIPFVNSVNYLGVIFDKKVIKRLHIEMIEAKAFRTFIRIYSLFRSERLCANIKVTLHKALIGVSWLMFATPGSLRQTTM
jgi:hypothetical protein